MEDNKNLIFAIVLCMIILLGWDYFILSPRVAEEQARQAAETEQLAEGGDMNGSSGAGPTLQGASDGNVSVPTVPGGAVPSAPSSSFLQSREDALRLSRRVDIRSDRLVGSVALKGGRIDDLSLMDYRETIDEDSDIITLLSPEGTEKAYFAEFGWVQPPNEAALIPTSNTVWSVVSRGDLTPTNPLRLQWDNGAGLRFTRQIELDENYMFTITQDVENYGSTPVTLYPYGLINRYDTPETSGFFILHEGMVGVLADELTEIDYGEIQDEKAILNTSTGGWLGLTDKYWMTALIPDQSTEFNSKVSDNVRRGIDIYQTEYVASPVVVAPNSTGQVSNQLFAGAKRNELLADYEQRLGIIKFDLAIDWGMWWFLTKPFFTALKYFGELFGNFGIGILVLTVLIKLALFPVANKSYVAMSRMKKLQPEMTKLRERYPDDKQKQQQEMMALYQREKVNPLAGCWPMLVQIPVFFALYKVLFVTIEMRHTPFFGWIQDLSAPDPTSIFNLFGLIPWTLPDFLLIGIWPIIMGVTMFVQTKMNPAPADPVQEKVFLFMPLFFTFLLASFPAGLVIYWAWNNLLSILQQYVIMTRQGVDVTLLENMGLDKLFKSKPSKSND